MSPSKKRVPCEEVQPWSTRNMPSFLLREARRIALRTGLSLEHVMAEAVRRGMPSVKLERRLTAEEPMEEDDESAHP